MKKLNSLGKISISALVFVTAFVMVGAAYLFVSPADALALSNKKDTLQTSAFGTLAQHTFVFTTGTALTTDATAGADFAFVVNFPVGGAGTDPFSSVLPSFVAGDFTATCTACASNVMNVTAVEASSNGGNASNDEFLIAINSTPNSATLPVASVVTLTFGASSGAQRLTNPANDHAGCTAGAAGTADICRITLNTTEAITGVSPALVDSGDVLVALIEGVTVSASISESLTFSIAGQTAANCTTDTGAPAPTIRDLSGSGTTVAFGAINNNTFYVGCQNLVVSTNAATGYNVTAQENTNMRDNTLPAASDTIPDTVCDSGPCNQTTGGPWTLEDSVYGFGYWCEEGLAGGGTPCDNAGDTTAEHRQFACTSSVADDCNQGTSEAAVTVMTGISAVNGNIGRIHYKLSVSGTQPAGTYDDSFITYIATGTF